MRARRVVMIASEYPPHVFGGLGTVVEALTGSLAGRGVGVELVVPRQPGYRRVPPGVRLLQVPVPGAGSDEDYWLRFCERAVATVRRALAGTAADLVHCHDWMTVLAGLNARDLLGVPLVLSVHLPQGSRPNLQMENLGLAHADAVLVNSRAVRRELVARRLAGRRMTVVPNGVDLDRFQPSTVPGGRGHLLFVGRLVSHKGVDLLLRAFGAVLRRCPGARLVVAGDGDQRLYLERLCRYLGLPPHVSFVGWQSGPALVRLYQEAVAVAVPSLYEPFGLVALEAMACGRPVVAARTGGLAEIVEDGVHGYLVDPGDHLQLAQRLAWLVLDRDLADTMGRAARAGALGFGWDRVAAGTERLYRRVLAAGPAPGRDGGLVDDLVGSVGRPSRARARRLAAAVADRSRAERGAGDGS